MFVGGGVGYDFRLAVIHFQMQRERQNYSALRGFRW